LLQCLNKYTYIIGIIVLIIPIINMKVGDFTMAQNPEWVELYEYVREKIMGYDKTIKLPKYMVLRLQGLIKGQFLRNKKQQVNAEYDYKTILITFKFCRQSILQAFEKNKTAFADENHKFNYAMIIIDKEINNVVVRLRNGKKSEEKTIKLELENQIHEGAEYKAKVKKVNKELEELW